MPRILVSQLNSVAARRWVYWLATLRAEDQRGADSIPNSSQGFTGLAFNAVITV